MQTSTGRHIFYNTHLYIKYIRRRQNKLTESHLLFLFLLACFHTQILPFSSIVGKNTQSTRRHRSVHDLVTMQQSNRRELQKRQFCFCLFDTEKEEGGDRSVLGVGSKSNIGGPRGRVPRIKSNSGKIHIKPCLSQQCPWNVAGW